MNLEGNLRKLVTELHAPVQYHLPVGGERVPVNELIGRPLSLEFTGEINCIHCGRKTSKSFSQGYCFPCMRSLAECDSCLVKPEQCHYHFGTCREPAWGEAHCFQDHFVYLANTSGLKVGITRQTNIPTRWMDQGATQALPIFRVRDRLTSGRLEVVLKQHVADKTAWQRMLKGMAADLDLLTERDRLYTQCAEAIDALRGELGSEAITQLPDANVIEIAYPVRHYPSKVTSLNFDKTPRISGVLNGIRGQYLVLDQGVLNVRKFSGYKVRLSL